MYSRDKILQVMQEIYEESKPIKPYVTIAQPRRDLKETAAQNLDGYEGLHIDVCGFSHAFVNIGGESVDVARNYLIEKAIESDAKYLLFVGEDTVLPYDGFRILHDTAEKNPDSMVVGVYYIKLSSPMIMINQNGYIIPANVEPGQIYEAWQTGLDAALIPISLLKKMKEDDPELPFTCIGNKINDLPFIGEDNFFVHRWRKLGYKLLVNTDVQCLHMDLASGKYTAHPSVKLNNYFTNIPITGELTMDDKKDIDTRWAERLPHTKKQDLNINKLFFSSEEKVVDGFTNILIQKNSDIQKYIEELNIQNDTIEEIFCSLLFDNSHQYDLMYQIEVIYRILKSYGILYIEMEEKEIFTKEKTSNGDVFRGNTIVGILSTVGFQNIQVSKTDINKKTILSIKTFKL